MKFRAIRTAVIMLLITALSAAVFAFAEDDIVYYDSREEAAAALREAMTKRSHFATVAINENVDEESIKTIIGDVFNMALEHTGEPDEGDYLKYEFEEYKGKAKTEFHWGTNAVVIRYVIDYYTDAAQEKETDKKVKEILKELDLEDKSDFHKIKAVHDYLCDNVDYDVEKAGNNEGGTEHTAYGALIEGKAVCQGYATSMYRLLLESGVDCRVIDGQGVEPGGLSESHSWNIASIGGVYFYVDATWDDSLASSEYFLKNRDEFETDHIRNEEYSEDFFTKQYPVSQSGFPFDYDIPVKALKKASKSTVEAFESLGSE